MAVKTSVKPMTKPSALRAVRAVPPLSPAAKYETYTGSIGSRQGDMKVMMPSRNVIRYCIARPLYSCYGAPRAPDAPRGGAGGLPRLWAAA